MTLSFRDKFSRIIRLPYERIQHIGAHMDLRDKLHLVEITLLHPDFISRDKERANILCYQKYIKGEHFYFIVVVKTFNGTGFILTLYPSEKLKQ